MSRQQANDKPVVMISSTAYDLPEHREQAMDACLRLGMFPKMMEHLPALDADAIEASLDRLVDEADVYVGIFAHRYGYVPEERDISITEMEYERAVERKIPRLIFLMHDDVPVLPKDFDRGEKAEKLEKLKERLKQERVVQLFESPKDLRGLVLHSLGEIQKELAADRVDEAGRPTAATLAESLHYVSSIPTPPEPYIAHPYTLLQVRRLVGRKDELDQLTDWVTKPEFEDTRIFNVVAIGGMGKSALTWTWFNEVAPQEIRQLSGRMWWSFYESDATFENFVTRALAYVSHRPLAEIERVSLTERERTLVAILDQEPFLLALDGLERILVAYARQDAAYLADEEDLDDRTANYVAGAMGLPESAGQSFVGRHQLRKTADFGAGQFLRKLSRVRASRILVSTRLYPADLQAPDGGHSPGCDALFLKGLSDQDSLELWRAYGARGAREAMLPLFRTIDSHPLLLQLLACEVAGFHAAPGDFEAWRAANPGFNPFSLPLVLVKSHVLAYSLRGLSDDERQTLHTIAGFRMPASMDTLKALLIRPEQTKGSESKLLATVLQVIKAFLATGSVGKPFTNLHQLDTTLTNLEDRGLLGWDRRANRYDLHPIVRGVVWSGLAPSARNVIYDALRSHFEALPTVDFAHVDSLEDLQPALELYNTLVGLKRFDDAFEVFEARLNHTTLYRLNDSRLRVELLERLFPDGIDAPFRLSKPVQQAQALNALAQGYQFSGQSEKATRVFQVAAGIYSRHRQTRNEAIVLSNLTHTLRVSGRLRDAEACARNALVLARQDHHRHQEGDALLKLGRTLGARGVSVQATETLRASLSIWNQLGHVQGQGIVNRCLAEQALWFGDAVTAKDLADRAWELANAVRIEADYISAAYLQGAAALQLNDLAKAQTYLRQALERARAVGNVEAELPTLIALAEMYRRRGEVVHSRVLLEDVWEPAERGPYPLFHADALNVLTQIERDVGNFDAAIKAATDAYLKAWCDGPSYSYKTALEKARQHLAALEVKEPNLAQTDSSHGAIQAARPSK